jgi:hypothetical protein
LAAGLVLLLPPALRFMASRDLPSTRDESSHTTSPHSAAIREDEPGGTAARDLPDISRIPAATPQREAAPESQGAAAKPDTMSAELTSPPLVSSTAAKSSLQPSTTGSAGPPASAEPDSDSAKTYLSAVAPMEVVGAAVEGAAFRREVLVSGHRYRQGIWMQPADDRGTSQISFALGNRYARLRGMAAIADDDADGEPADGRKLNAVFRIYGDGNLLWDSEPLTASGSHQDFEVEIRGVDILALVAESDAPSEASRLVWVDVEVIQDTAPPCPE